MRIGRGDPLKGVSKVVKVSMVTGGAEIDVGTFGTFPADPVEWGGVATITAYAIVFNT